MLATLQSDNRENMAVSEKLYVDANSLLDDSFRLGGEIIASGFRPDLLLVLWRGGTPIGIAIQELLTYRDIPHHHLPIKTSHYAGMGRRRGDIVIDGLEAALPLIDSDTRLLIVDDVFDTGLTLQTLVNTLLQQSPLTADNLKIATPWYKPANNRTALTPDYYLHETDRWIVFPHELAGLDKAEILAGKSELPALAQTLV